MNTPVSYLRKYPALFAGLVAAITGVLLFHFFGNSVRGYIDTGSAFYWWSHLWFIGDGDTEHGPIILAVALLIFLRNVLGMKSTVGRIMPPHGLPVVIAALIVYLGYFLVDSEWFMERYDTSYMDAINLGTWLLWLVFGAFLYAIFRNWKHIPTTDAEPRILWAVVLLMGALFLHWVGFVAQQTRISLLAMLGFTMGVAALMGGKRWAGALFFPLVLLLMAMPLGFLTDELGFHMRMWVIKATTTVSHLIGIDVIQNGTNLKSPDGSYAYDVAPACSGVRSLMALTALSLVIGYLSFQSTWRRLTLLVLALPFAYVGNVVRITAIVFAGEWFGQEAGTQVHDNGGMLIFLAVLGLSLLTVQIILKVAPEKEEDASAPIGVPEGGGLPVSASRTRPIWLTAAGGVAFSLLLALAIVWVNQKAISNQTGLFLARDRVNPVELPTFLGMDWIGRPAKVSEAEREVLPDDTGFSRKWYQNMVDTITLSDGSRMAESVFLSIVLSGRDRTSIHKPEICLVGQGWTIRGRSEHTFAIDGIAGGGLPVTILDIEQRAVDPQTARPILDDNGEPILREAIYAYWFVGGDVMVPTHAERMLQMAKDRVLRLKSHRWAYITAQTSIPDGREAGLARIQEILSYALPEFQRVGFKETAESEQEVARAEIE